MLSLIIENLSHRFRNIQDPYDVLTGYWNAIDVGICRDHDIYHEVFFTDETNVPTCDSQIEEKTVTKRGDWGVYKETPNQYRVVWLKYSPPLIVYHTCSNDSADQMAQYLFDEASSIKGPKLTKTVIKKIGPILRKFRPVFDTTYFASGLNVIGEYFGFTDRNMNIGVAVTYYDSKTGKHRFMNQKNINILRELSTGQSDLQRYKPKIFVDSGAFSVGIALIKYETGDSSVEPKPLDFANVLKMYDKLIKFDAHLNKSDPKQFYFVAPDVIGNPRASLDALKKYKNKLREIIDKGANLIVPLHDSSEIPMWEFHKQTKKILKRDFIAGIPTVKGVTKLERFIEYMKRVHVGKIHFLGMGYFGKYYRPFIEAVQCYNPKATVYLDAVRLTALIGRAKDRKGESIIDDYIKLRGRDKPYTRKRDEAEKELIEEEFRDSIMETIEDIDFFVDSSERYSKIASLDRKLRLNLDDITVMTEDGDAEWLDDYMPDIEYSEGFDRYKYPSNPLENLYRQITDRLSLLSDSEVVMMDMVRYHPSVAIDIADELLRNQEVLDDMGIEYKGLEVLARSGRYPQLEKYYDLSIPDEDALLIEGDLSYEPIDPSSVDDDGLWSDDFFRFIQSFPDEVIDYLVQQKKEAIAESEFYAEKTRRAINKLSDKDLAKIGGIK